MTSELEARVNVLEAKVSMLYTLRKQEREITTRAWEQQLREAAQDEAKAIIPDNRSDDLDNDTTNAGSVKIFPPAIEDELDALPPHEGHGGAV